MNAGQYLLALSPLPSGTAAQHLLAIQLGTGTGQTIFCSQRTVVFEQDETTVTRKAKPAPAAEKKGTQAPAKAGKDDRNVYVEYAVQRLTVVGGGTEEITVTRRAAQTVVTGKDDRVVSRGSK